MHQKYISYMRLGSLAGFFILLGFALFLDHPAHSRSAIPGPYLVIALKAPLTPSPTPTPTATPSYGILLISEAMVQPGSSEPDGEWVELYNAGGGTLLLSSYKLGDEETRGQGEGMVQFPAGASLASGQVIIIAYNAASFAATYGFNPDYEITSSSPAVPDMRRVPSWANGTINLGNNGDEVLLLDHSDLLVDALSWGDSSWAFYPPCPAPGSAWTLERYPAYIDTDSSNDWRIQPYPTPGTIDLTPPTATPSLTPTQTASRTASPSRTVTSTHSPTGTPTRTLTASSPPGFTPSPSPTPAQTSTPTSTITGTIIPTISPTPTATPLSVGLLISEVLYDPFGFEPDAEWIELYNAGGEIIDLSNYKVGDNVYPGFMEGMYQFPTGAVILSEQVLIVANRADVFTNTYGFYPDYEFIDSEAEIPDLILYLPWAGGYVSLSNPGDEVLVLNQGDNYVDAVSWGDSDWAFNPDCPVLAEGHSLERFPAAMDTDTAADWIDQPVPNPGQVYFEEVQIYRTVQKGGRSVSPPP